MRTLFCALLLAGSAFGQTARDIVVLSIRAAHSNARIASRYTYRQEAVEHEYDRSGRRVKTHWTTEERLFLGGKPYDHLIQKDGKPLTGDDAAKEQRKFDRAASDAASLSEPEKEKRLNDYAREQQKELDHLQSIPDAYDFRQLADEAVGSRPCYVIAATPKASYRGKYAGLYRNLKGRIWIDKGDYEWARFDAQVLNDIRWGLFLAKVAKGSEIHFERVRVNDEIWLPKQLMVRADARALFKRVSLDVNVTFSDFHKYQSDSRVVSTGETK